MSRHNSKLGAVVTGPPQRQKQQEQNFVRILGIFVTGPPQRQIQAKLSSSSDFLMIDFVPGPPKRVQNSANSTSIKMVIRSPPKGSS